MKTSPPLNSSAPQPHYRSWSRARARELALASMRIGHNPEDHGVPIIEPARHPVTGECLDIPTWQRRRLNVTRRVE
ncbi:MAG: hypothetical protein B9S32_13770 [Verrucomicrobia bacterium Tous-C9LFEB]|nr:MAG: hypothetical protein B9S32_13770 [Verrucomicrobia bacterium Tous-C9LFEB]